MYSKKSTLYLKAKKYENKLIEWRRHIHKNPELGFEEFQTTNYIVDQLKDIGITDIKVGVNNVDVGIVANITVKDPKKTIALRADIDALPLKEENTCEYASNNGLMHACGHDAHVSMLLGACSMLKDLADNNELENNVRFIFQPAEETTGGAKFMIAEGVLDGVDKIYGIHISSGLPSGVIGYKAGAITASPDEFKVTIQGKGGHAAYPNTTKDPIIVAGNIITSAQSIVSREINPFDQVVLSITYVKSGTAYNIIPNTAELGGTVRTINNDLRNYMAKRLPELVKDIAKAHGCTADVNYIEHYPATINHGETTNNAVEILKEEFGDNEFLTEIQASMGGEDFSYFTKEVDGVFIRLGSKGSNQDTHFSHHHPRFNIDESVLIKGAMILYLLSSN